MDRSIKYIINKNISINDFLKEKCYTENLLKYLRNREGSVYVNRNNRRDEKRLKEELLVGDILEVIILEDRNTDDNNFNNSIYKKDEKLVVESFNFNNNTNKYGKLDISSIILYEDEDLIIINKPSGMATHNSINHYGDSLQSILSEYYKNEKSPFIFRGINRLDKDTSGIVLVGKNKISGSILGTLQSEKKIYKEYECIVDGIIEDNGTINKPIKREENSIIKRTIGENPLDGEEAVTHYYPIEYIKRNDKNFTKLKIVLETGRTHQIRVHLKSIGHPLLGDILYNPDFSVFNRLTLNCSVIRLNHPITSEIIEIRNSMGW